MKKFLIGAVALITAAAPIAVSAAPFGHGGRPAAVANRSGWNGGYRSGYRGDIRGERGNGGAAIAAGLFGLAIGAAIASSSQPEYAPNYGYGYGDCGWQTEAVRGPYGQIRYEQVQVCN
jgi:opacity protein-like surface antigen